MGGHSGGRSIVAERHGSKDCIRRQCSATSDVGLVSVFAFVAASALPALQSCYS